MDELNITPMDIYNENKEDLDIDTIVYYLLKGGELDEVPEEFITQELFKEYITKGGMLIKVPRKFITQELFNDYFSRNFNSPTFLLDMPEDIITENMIKFFIKNTKEKEWIKYIPKSHITDNIKERYIESIGGINEYINNLIEIIKKFKKIELNEYLEIVPKKYIEDVCSKLLIEFKSKIELPKSYITESIKEKVFLALGGLDTFIDYFNTDELEYLLRRHIDNDEFRFMENIIPNKYRKIICEKIFEKKRHILDGLLIDYWTEDMIKKSIKTTNSIPRFVTDNPEKYLNILLYCYELTGNIRVVPTEVRDKVLNLYIAKYNDIEKRAKDGDIDYLLTIYMTTKNINLIPPEFHEEVYKAYLFKYNSIVGIPEDFLMSICTDYFQSEFYYSRRSNIWINNIFRDTTSLREDYVYPEGYEDFLKKHFAETFSLEEVPYILGHRSESVKYYYEKIGGPENIPDDKKEELFRYIFNRTFDLRLIPKKYVTKEMIDNYYEQGYYEQIDRIPAHLLTEEICKKYIGRKRKISSISSAYIRKHPELYNYYLHCCPNVRTIPKNLINREICLEFVRTQKRLPRNCDELLLENPDIFIEYFNLTNDLKSIPIEFRSDEMISRYAKNGGDLSKVDDEYLRQHLNLYADSFNKTHDLRGIPDELITDEMCNTYLQKYHRNYSYALSMIPEKNRENVYFLFVKETGRLDLIPDEYKTREMCLEYFNKNNDIEYIPKQYLSSEMCKIYFEKYCLNSNVNEFERIYNIPPQYMTAEMIDYITEKSGLSINELPNNIKLIIVKYELFNIKPGTKKYEISSKLGVGNYLVDKALEEIKQNNPEEYEKIQKVFKKNSAAMFAVYLKHIKELENIILSLGNIGNKLTKEQQIKFSYLLGQEHLYYLLQSIYDKLLASKRKEIPPIVYNFIQKHLVIKARRKMDSKGILSNNEYYAATWGANWLKYFRLDEKFKTINGKTTTIKYINQEGNQIEITREIAQEVINTLIENDIQPINCIVNAALLSYASGNLEQLITQIKSYDNYKSETEKNARRR